MVMCINILRGAEAAGGVGRGLVGHRPLSVGGGEGGKKRLKTINACDLSVVCRLLTPTRTCVGPYAVYCALLCVD